MYGVSEDPMRSVGPHVDAADYPTDRDELVAIAEDNGAPPSIINLLRNLPSTHYASRNDVLRDLSEAARRMATGPSQDDDALRDRRNIGRRATEDSKAPTRHP